MNFIIELHPYDVDCMVSITEKDEVLEKKFKNFGVCKQDIKEQLWHLSENADGIGVNFSCGRSLIRLNHKPINQLRKGQLAHEIFHVSDFVLRRAGFRLNDKSCEAWAYLIAFITREVYKKLK